LARSSAVIDAPLPSSRLPEHAAPPTHACPMDAAPTDRRQWPSDREVSLTSANHKIPAPTTAVRDLLTVPCHHGCPYNHY